MRTLIVILCLVMGMSVYGETLTLRDNTKYSGSITKRDDKGIWFRMKGLEQPLFFAYSKLADHHRPGYKPPVAASAKKKKADVVDAKASEAKAKAARGVDTKGDVGSQIKPIPKGKFPQYPIEAVVVTLKTGQQLVGLPAKGGSSTKDELLLQTLQGEIRIQKEKIFEQEAREVAGDLLVKREDYYRWVMQTHNPKTVEDQLDLARVLASMKLESEALLHYQRVRVLGLLGQQEIDDEIKRLKSGLALETLDDPLMPIKKLIGAKDYDRAISVLTNRIKDMEDSAEKQRMEALLTRATDAKTKHVDKRIITMYYRNFENLLKRRAFNRSGNLSEDLAYIKAQLKTDIETDIMEDLEIDQAKLDEIWGSRESKGLGYTTCMYNGTWLSPLAATLKQTTAGGKKGQDKKTEGEGEGEGKEGEAAEKKGKDEKSPEFEAALNEVEGGLSNLSEKSKKKPDDFWRGAKGKIRAEILMALGAESIMKIKERGLRTCPACNGTGSKKKLSAGTKSGAGKEKTNGCASCLGTGSFREITYY